MSTLLVPELRRGHGTGHLRRCLKLVASLPDAQILLPEHGSADRRGRDELGELVFGLSGSQIASTNVPAPDQVVLDLFDATASGVLSYGSAVTIGLDIGGEGRDYCSYVVDSLPRLGGTPGNLSDSSLLELPEYKAISESARDRILVSFGGEDPAALTESTVTMLVESLGIAPGSITVVRPGLRSLSDLPAGVRVVGPLPSLQEVMDENEWMICSHGLTAFEATAAGRSVVTIAPTTYHDRLAAVAGFVRAGVLRPDQRRLAAALIGSALPVSTNVAEGEAPVPGAASRKPGRLTRSLADLIMTLQSAHVGCPAHPGTRGTAVWRNEEKSYFRCPKCAVIYLERFRSDHEEYGASYFDDEYRKQYGKSYLDDFGSIKEMGLRRCARIAAAGGEGHTLLDVGCAYGPFLQASRESGLDPYGIDVSAEAVEYVRSTLRFPAMAGSVLEVDPLGAFGVERFDIITMWYVVEHFEELSLLLSRLSGWLRPGGTLALATPNAVGVSGRRNNDSFLAGSPRDHHTILSPASAASIIEEHGYKVKQVVSTGHHPERYPAVRKGLLPRRLADAHSRLFGWGDTFELYATLRNPKES